MEKFYLGMDIGTESVGMACTDEHYNLLRAKGKDLWAVRLFDEAKDAKERRTKRTARRRLQRRRQRIEWLQDIFAPFMDDEYFFIRLNNSAFYEEDKDARLDTKYSLFNDFEYSDKEFYREYPTIFHLRCDLANGKNKKVDLRHYYLALHHIVKYRGHFLFEGENVGDIRDVKKLFENYNALISEYGIELDVGLSEAKAEEFKTLALSRKGKNDKKKEGALLFDATSTEKKEWVFLLLGVKVAPKKLFGAEYQEKYKDEKSFSFDELTDEAFEAMQENYEEDHFALLQAARAIYNFTVFEKVLDGSSCISEAMVGLYNKHKTDLATLKNFVKKNYPLKKCVRVVNNKKQEFYINEVYYNIFRSRKGTANYVNYIGYNQSKTQKQSVKKCEAEDFYKFLAKILTSEPVSDKATLDNILKELDEKTFLPKILHADNGLFPHQINGMELNAILDNLCAQYPAFAEVGADGYSPKQKIQKIFKYKIPYYVGPLNTAGENAWMKRNQGKTEKITPWNFDEIVDKTASNEEFIRRMTNKCTYLRGKDVLPKGSMYYQAFDVLNQINKLTLEGKPIDLESKQEIFQNIYREQKKVTAKQIEKYLVCKGKCSGKESSGILGGFDKEVGLKASMNSYVTFKAKFGALVDKNPEIFENIILWHTLNTDKTLVEEAVLKAYGNVPEIKENIKWIKGLTSFKEFGRFSKELLCDLSVVNKDTGEIFTILNRLYHTNENFNQLLFSEEYPFAQAIQEANAGITKDEISYDDVKELYVSPMVRRGIWQALQMADEYVNALGKAPDKIFIEVTRQDGEKKRTVSRKNKLKDLYKEIEKECKEVGELSKELARDNMTDSRLRSERLYLYFLQLGKCAYTGNRINLEELMGNRYDVDHIIPQSMTKDDSLDNKVLVERQKNAEKGNQYPLPMGFTTQQEQWKLLKKKGLMSESKYNRLCRKDPLDDDDFRDFINRQLVVTNQTAKAVAELLKQKYEPLGTKIVYSKAKNVDDFKQKHGIVKCRETNDLHHARDAYLNVVVGNIYDTKFASKHAYRYKDQEGTSREYNLDNLYRWKIDGAWNGASDVDRVKKIAQKCSMCVTRYAYTNQGAFYNETVYGKNENAIGAPRKMCAPYNQTEKYGGFKSLTTAYFAIVQSKDKKGNLIKTIEAIPVLVDYQTCNNENAVMEYLQNSGLVEPNIIIPKLKVKSLVAIRGYKVWIAGVASGNRIIIHNAQQWFTNADTDNYVKQLVKLIEKDKNGGLSALEKAQEKIPLTSNRKGVTLYATKEQNMGIYEKVLETLRKDCYQGLSAVESFAIKLQEKKTLFVALTTFEQCKVLLQIIRVMKCNAEKADLTLLQDGANCGGLLMGKNITDVGFAIIHQSPCGLVERIQKI